MVPASPSRMLNGLNGENTDLDQRASFCTSWSVKPRPTVSSSSVCPRERTPGNHMSGQRRWTILPHCLRRACVDLMMIQSDELNLDKPESQRFRARAQDSTMDLLKLSHKSKADAESAQRYQRG